MTPLSLLLTFSALLGSAFAQPVAYSSVPFNWNDQYYSVDGTTAVSIAGTCVDLVGNTFAVGWAVGNFETHVTAGPSTAIIMKFGPDGTRLFLRFLDSLRDEQAAACQTDSTGGVYVVGRTFGYLSTVADPPSSNNYYYDMFVARFDSTGSLSWVRQLDSFSNAGWYSGNSNAAAVDVDSSNNAYVLIHASNKLFLAQFSPSNALVWSTQIGTTSNNYDTYVGFSSNANLQADPTSLNSYYSDFSEEYGNPLDCDATGNCYVAFATAGSVTYTNGSATSNGYTDVFVSAVNPAGVIQWTYAAGSPQNDYALAVAIDATGNVWMAGETSGVLAQQPPFGARDAFVIKLSTSAQVLFTRVFGSAQEQGVTSMVSDRQGGMYLIVSQQNTYQSLGAGADYIDGINFPFVPYMRFAYLLQMDAFGNRLWDNVLNAGSPSNYFYSNNYHLLAPKALSTSADGTQVVVGGMYQGLFNEAFSLFANSLQIPKGFIFSFAPQATCNATTFNAVMTEITSLLYTLGV